MEYEILREIERLNIPLRMAYFSQFLGELILVDLLYLFDHYYRHGIFASSKLKLLSQSIDLMIK